MREKILLAMSGGVDSSVSAALLIEQGYEVIGAFLKVYSGENHKSEILNHTSEECWVPEYRDALAVAEQLKISLHFFDFEKEYRARVLEYLYAEYAAGRTPNPDVLCNRDVKFDLLLKEADRLGCAYIATGHYARVKKFQIPDSRFPIFELRKGVDPEKDQSYFLHQLGQRELARAIFPVGEMTKSQVRQRARELGLPVADKRSTRGICFVGKVVMSDFLRERIAMHAGPIVTTCGARIGEHRGLEAYTIGQREGIGIGGGAPYFVVDKRFEDHTLIVAEGENDPALFARECAVRDMHWIVNTDFPSPPGGEGEGEGFWCDVKLRYRHSGVRARVYPAENGGVRLVFAQPQRAVTPGQFAVLYDGEVCLGGGPIEES